LKIVLGRRGFLIQERLDLGEQARELDRLGLLHHTRPNSPPKSKAHGANGIPARGWGNVDHKKKFTFSREASHRVFV
jgi:hypothetical protein